jgi:hypothetical protein
MLAGDIALTLERSIKTRRPCPVHSIRAPHPALELAVQAGRRYSTVFTSELFLNWANGAMIDPAYTYEPRGVTTHPRDAAKLPPPLARLAKFSRFGRRNGEYDTVDRMARRSTSPTNEQLTHAELEELRLRLEAMPQHELGTFYRATHSACRYALRLPSARMIQELVQAWKALRRRT